MYPLLFGKDKFSFSYYQRLSINIDGMRHHRRTCPRDVPPTGAISIWKVVDELKDIHKEEA